jgi:LCP family protein required for cell wall assembly
VVLGYLVFPERFTILILGIDRTPEGNVVGRSDTNILLDVQTLSAEVRTYSIPRDLWVNIPYYGENRINTAHFLGEANQAGEGPALTMSTIRKNFGIQSDYYVRIQLEEFPKVVDALGGIKIDLPYKMGGLKKGVHKLNGDEALAFVRDRSGTDDFQRMQQGQVFARALIKNLANPLKWPRLPFFLAALNDVVDTDIPTWEWPRMGFAMLRAVVFGNYHSSTLPRKMTSSWVTPEGAMVLLPDWPQIIPHALKALGYQ